jgi:hypothetical protein
VIKHQICEATDPHLRLDRASLDAFTVAGLREAVARGQAASGGARWGYLHPASTAPAAPLTFWPF